MWVIWVKQLSPQALKSCPMCNKLPNMVTLQTIDIIFRPSGAAPSTSIFTSTKPLLRLRRLQSLSSRRRPFKNNFYFFKHSESTDSWNRFHDHSQRRCRCRRHCRLKNAEKRRSVAHELEPNRHLRYCQECLPFRGIKCA